MIAKNINDHIAVKIAKDTYNTYMRDNIKYFPKGVWPISFHDADVQIEAERDACGDIHMMTRLILRIKKRVWEESQYGTWFETKSDFGLSTYKFNINEKLDISKLVKEVKETLDRLIKDHYLHKKSKYKASINPCAEIELPNSGGECVKFTHMNGIELDEPMVAAPIGKPKTKIDNELLLLLNGNN